MPKLQKDFEDAWTRGNHASDELLCFLDSNQFVILDSTKMGDGVLAILRAMYCEHKENPRALRWIDDVLKEPQCPGWLKEGYRDGEDHKEQWSQYRENMHWVFLTCALGVSEEEALLASMEQLSVANVIKIQSETETTIRNLHQSDTAGECKSNLPSLGFYYDLCHFFTQGEFPKAQMSVQTIVGLVEEGEQSGHVAELLVEVVPRTESWPHTLPNVYAHPEQAFRPIDDEFQESILDALNLAIKASGVNEANNTKQRFDFRYSLTDRCTKATISALIGKSAGAAFSLCFSQLLSKS